MAFASYKSASGLVASPLQSCSKLPSLLPSRPVPVGRSALRVNAILEKGNASNVSVSSPSATSKEIMDKLLLVYGKTDIKDAKDVYQGVAWTVRERLMDAFEKTHAHWR